MRKGSLLSSRRQIRNKEMQKRLTPKENIFGQDQVPGTIFRSGFGIIGGWAGKTFLAL